MSGDLDTPVLDVPASVIAAYGLRAIIISGFVLAFLSTSSVEQYLSQPIVQLFSLLAEWIVRTGNGSIVREGNVLIEPVTGAKVYVTQACDGLGLWQFLWPCCWQPAPASGISYARRSF